jgi:hypothetical protein
LKQKPTHYNNLQEFTKHLSVENNFYQWRERVCALITENKIKELSKHDNGLIPFIKQIMKEAYDSFGKYEKPFYCEDLYHNSIWCTNNEEWRKVEANYYVEHMYVYIVSSIQKKAKKLGIIKQYTKDMIIDMYLESYPVYDIIPDLDEHGTHKEDDSGYKMYKHVKKQRCELKENELPHFNYLDRFKSDNQIDVGQYIKSKEFIRMELPRDLEQDYDKCEGHSKQMMKDLQTIGYIRKEDLN